MLTQDFRTWIRAGVLTDPLLDDRDVILFPEKIGGKYWMLHRPLEWVGPEYGCEHPAIWISSADDLLGFREAKLLAKQKFDWEADKIGANTPPIRTQHGWLTLYHAVGQDKFYRLGALLLDLEDPTHRPLSHAGLADAAGRGLRDRRVLSRLSCFPAARS